MKQPEAANDVGDARLVEALTLARGHYEAGRVAEAEQAYREILDRHPEQPQAMHLLGYLSYQAGRTHQALELIGRAIAFDAEAPAYRSDLALVLWASGRPAEAARSGKLAIALRPGFPEAWLNLGNAEKDLGDPAAAIRCYRRTLALDRRRVEAWNQMAITRIEEGRFDWLEAWPEFEWRLRVKAMAKARLHVAGRRWDGSTWSGDPAAAPAVLVHAEQGLGDTIMFARFAPRVAARFWQVVLVVQPELVGLLGEGLGSDHLAVGAFPGDGIDLPLPPYEAQVPLMSLPALLAIEPASVPSEPYLRADPDRLVAWRARLAEAAPRGLRVGLVWAGNPRRANLAGAAVDRRRSLSLQSLAPLGGVSGVTFFALQLGQAGLEARQPPPGLRLVDLAPEIRDFRDSAAILAGLDLLISVDTAAAHLAGALGRPVWLLNRFDTDWRWLWQRVDSPWYPSLAIYRQRHPGDWPWVIERVRADLATLASGRSSA